MAPDHTGAPIGVSNTEFLGHIGHAAPDGTVLWVTHFIGNPSAASPWGGQLYGAREHQARIADDWARYNTYFSVAALHPDGDGEFKRRKANFDRLLALVADDAHPDGLAGEPSWVLQTSPGKVQVGILLDETDPDGADEPLVTAVVNVMARRGLIGGDLSGNNIVRYVRLPQGQNQKPRESGAWTHRLERWSPGVRYSLDDACAVFGIDLDEVRAELAAPQVQQSVGIGGDQEDKLRDAVQLIIQGRALHESLNRAAASLVASGAHGGAVVNTLRALMESSQAPRDDRWRDRYNDIPRSVSGAEERYRREALAMPPVEIALGESGAPSQEPVALFMQAGELIEQVGPIKWLVDGYLEQEAVSVTYGPSAIGKSFVVIDQACAIATGTAWHGRRTTRGAVFYLAGEGHGGMRRRLAAWQKARGISLREAPMFVSRAAVNLMDTTSLQAMVAEVDTMAKMAGVAPALVVVDTLARSMGDGDENAAKDINQVVAALDAIKLRYSCHVLVVHHSGHEATRARGSSALRGAMDQEFSVSGGNGVIEYASTKMKDAEKPDSLSFKLERVVIGVDDQDVEISSAVPNVAGDPLGMSIGKMADGSPVTVRALADNLVNGWPGRETLAIMLGVSVKACRLLIDRAFELGVVVKDGRGYVLSGKVLDKMSMSGGLLVKQENGDE